METGQSEGERLLNRNDQGFLNQVDGDWVDSCNNEWELLTALMLDTRTPLERLHKVVRDLKGANLLDYRVLREEYKKHGRKSIANLFRNAGYPWYNQKSKFFNQDISFDLKTATFEQIDSINGIGPKLASLWMRIMHSDRQNDFVVIDTHVKRFLRELGHDEAHMSYERQSEILREEARLRGLTITELDELIVSNGIHRRRGEPTIPIPERVTLVKGSD